MREVVLQKDLAVNASRYKWNRAAPEPEMLQVVWGTWMYAAFAAALASFTDSSGASSAWARNFTGAEFAASARRYEFGARSASASTTRADVHVAHASAHVAAVSSCITVFISFFIFIYENL